MRPSFRPPLSGPTLAVLASAMIASCGYAAVRLVGPWSAFSHLSATGLGIALGFVGGIAVMLAEDDPKLYHHRDTGELARAREDGIAIGLRMARDGEASGAVAVKGAMAPTSVPTRPKVRGDDGGGTGAWR